ncbi:hypothetical protein PAECIP111893_01265 [Paenibacillus plantiphilus]|uniref:Uncharacterized protein n=1 Tax=Paenibacillus plantiphilus TaxID=2905650 RepID=A0ABN8G6F8_9BACL|nr:hypothetical protein PAECIP111893_01265 [Paenibacillus plantiphilus]
MRWKREIDIQSTFTISYFHSIGTLKQSLL